ncbi:MAG: DNA repair exonuclease [Deltaproteobacteria bacterium]|nr:DNA repair exonuclease [Deltaproteobacteria bacterium]
MRLLAVGDIHLGRTPSRLSDAVKERFRPRELGPSEAWKRAVECALTKKVDAVLLAGDVVEDKDDFFEAFRDLSAGVKQLIDAGILVVGVSGNHDVSVLPRLAASLEGFRLLGGQGVWEAVELGTVHGTRVLVLGWSFPSERVEDSPLVSLPVRRGADRVIGLLHCDRDQSRSHYAPVRSSELEAAPVDAWLLGHIHKPDDLTGKRPMAYLGSLTGMDPGEPGPHGPWIVEIEPNGISATQIPLAPLRWETVDVDVTHIDDPDDLPPRILEALDALHAKVDAHEHQPKALGCRLRLTGRSAHRQAFEEKLSHDDPRSWDIRKGALCCFVHDVQLSVEPRLALTEMAKACDPVGLLARRVLALRSPDSEDGHRLVAKARERFKEVQARPSFRARGLPDEQAIRARLESAALVAIDRLLRQREGSS